MTEEVNGSENEIAWLKTASPDDWHRVALDFNWGEDIEPLYWIVQQPDCDRATALDIFWKGQPAWYLFIAVREGEKQDAKAEDPIWTMLKYIAARLNARGYRRSKIAFDATPELKSDFEELTGYVKEMQNPPLQPHADMLRSLRGREVVNDADFYRRYPFAHSAWIDLPPIDQDLIERVPDLVAARSDASSVVTNLFGLGFLFMGVVIYPMLLQNMTFLVLGLAGFGWCLYAAISEYREMTGLLRVNRLQLMPPYLIGTLVLAGLSGVGLAAIALKPVVQLRAELTAALGMMGTVAIIFVGAAIAGLAYWVIGKSLARVLISPRAMREF